MAGDSIRPELRAAIDRFVKENKVRGFSGVGAYPVGAAGEEHPVPQAGIAVQRNMRQRAHATAPAVGFTVQMPELGRARPEQCTATLPVLLMW